MNVEEVEVLRVEIRKEVLEIGAYPAGKTIGEVKREYGLETVVKLASNENPLGSSLMAAEAVQNLQSGFNMYPDPSARDLKLKIAESLHINSDQVFCGAGSDFLIRIICSCLINPGDESIVGEVTFPRYEDSTMLMSGKVVRIPMKDNMLDIKAMVDAITERTKIIWFCNPNNPTGTIFTQQEFMDVLADIPPNVLIVMDEAYYEYVTDDRFPDSLSFIDKYPNMVVLRTFSKAYGLAGLRVGYGICCSELAKYFNAVIGPFDVSLVAQAAAAAAIKDTEFIKKSREVNIKGRDYLYQKFESMGLPYIKTQANFIMVNTKIDDKFVFNELLKRGIIVKPGSSLNMPGFIRVTIGTMEQNEKFIDKLKEIL